MSPIIVGLILFDFLENAKPFSIFLFNYEIFNADTWTNRSFSALSWQTV